MKHLLKKFLISNLLILSTSSFAINTVATGFRVTDGSTVEIDAHGVCQNVTNSTGSDQFISTKSAPEWTSFRANLPTNITLGPCGANLTYAGSTHTEADCTGSGGSVVTVTGAVTLCRFNSSACPGGWANASNWSTTTAKSETKSYGARTCSIAMDCQGSSPADLNVVAASKTLTTGSHTWMNRSRESANCRVIDGCGSSRDLDSCINNPADWNYQNSESTTVSTSSYCTSAGGTLVVENRLNFKNINTNEIRESISINPNIQKRYTYANIVQIGCR